MISHSHYSHYVSYCGIYPRPRILELPLRNKPRSDRVVLTGSYVAYKHYVSIYTRGMFAFNSHFRGRVGVGGVWLFGKISFVGGSFVFVLTLYDKLTFTSTPRITGDVSGATRDLTPTFGGPCGSMNGVPIAFPGRPPLIPRDVHNLRMAGGTGRYLNYRTPSITPAANTPHIPRDRFLAHSNRGARNASPHHCFYLRYRIRRAGMGPVVRGGFRAVHGARNGWKTGP